MQQKKHKLYATENYPEIKWINDDRNSDQNDKCQSQNEKVQKVEHEIKFSSLVDSFCQSSKSFRFLCHWYKWQEKAHEKYDEYNDTTNCHKCKVNRWEISVWKKRLVENFESQVTSKF